MGLQTVITWLIALLAGVSNAVATLESLEQVDDFPLYTMTYYGSYEENIEYAEEIAGITDLAAFLPDFSNAQFAWGCSLFTAFAAPESAVYGRNFDWQFSPALLLFTDPPDGYASVSMVDIQFLGFQARTPREIRDLTERPLDELVPLLYAPLLPIDGMNEHGLTVAMAAVPPGDMAMDSGKETVGSLMIMRLILNHARTVDEAIDLIRQYNISMAGGPPVHYLIADTTGQAALVEFYEGELYVIPNEHDWYLATNHLRAAVAAGENISCARYDRIEAQLTESEGLIDTQAALDLLESVSGRNTQWSVVYGMSTGEITIVLGRDYDEVHRFQLELAREQDEE